MIAHRWRRLVVGSPPSFDLFLSVHFDGFLFVFADQLAITPLVQTPMLWKKEKEKSDIFLAKRDKKNLQNRTIITRCNDLTTSRQ